MIKNYIKIALRNISKYKGCFFINIAGLAVGMAVCILILLYVQDELSYDDYNEHADRIYRIERASRTPDGSIEPYFCTLAPSFVPLMEKDFPEIEHAVPLFNPENFTYSKLSIDKSGPVRSGACSEIRVEALDHTSIYT